MIMKKMMTVEEEGSFTEEENLTPIANKKIKL